MRPDNFDVNKIIETCSGSCMETIQSAIEFHYPEMDEDDLTEDDINHIDNEIFNCSTCGWWCEISDESGTQENELVCNDCAEENEED